MKTRLYWMLIGWCIGSATENLLFGHGIENLGKWWLFVTKGIVS